jgi:hypothetical protein
MKESGGVGQTSCIRESDGLSSGVGRLHIYYRLGLILANPPGQCCECL